MKSLKNLVPAVLLILASCAREPVSVEDEIKSIENGLLTKIHVKGDSVLKYTIEERMKHHKVPGVSIAIVRDGVIRWAKGYGVANQNTSTAVNNETMFQAGSISKPLAALAALKLVDEGKVDLDVNVNEYLKDWKVEENEKTAAEKVTLRRLLTHTAGTTVHGFPGYLPTDTFPSITDVLTGKGNTPRVYVNTPPDSIWRYSGGGYTIMEKVVEDVTGLPLEKYMAENVLRPLQMSNSTYEQPLSETFHPVASAAYDSQGKIIEGLWHNYPEQAAAGLWTTPTDLARYCIAVQDGLSGKSAFIFSKPTLEAMITKHKNNWGLGPSMESDGNALRFGHGGKNAGFTNSMTAFAHKGDAVIIMTNADNGGRIIDEILRSVSLYYDWEIRDQREIELEDLSAEELDKFTGKYLYTDDSQSEEKYFVELTREGDILRLIDSNRGQTTEMSAIDESKFIDLESGDEFAFRSDSDVMTSVINNQYRFKRVN